LRDPFRQEAQGVLEDLLDASDVEPDYRRFRALKRDLLDLLDQAEQRSRENDPDGVQAQERRQRRRGSNSVS
jgi:hypothetical protein